jgi:5-methyltetrahydropteroyltriglutamate--homocysteine methyltransferase
MAAAVMENVRRQKAAGIDIVSDGEAAKISYATYVKDRYTGFAGDSPRNAPADLKLFPSFLERLARQGGTPRYARPQCVGPVESRGQDELARDMAEEYRTIVDAGLDLQVDCPDLALSRHMLFAHLSDDEFLAIAATHVEALKAALAGIPEHRVRVHICWGNYEGPHVCDIAMDRVFPLLMSVPARQILFETANPRHGHEWAVFRDRAAEIPPDRVLVPGVIDSTTNFVEHPDLVAERLCRFVDIVGADRVIAGSDCGFGTFAGFGAVDPEIAWAKLASLAEGARRAG